MNERQDLVQSTRREPLSRGHHRGGTRDTDLQWRAPNPAYHVRGNDGAPRLPAQGRATVLTAVVTPDGRVFFFPTTETPTGEWVMNKVQRFKYRSTMAYLMFAGLFAFLSPLWWPIH
jgi:hypothetical protein